MIGILQRLVWIEQFVSDPDEAIQFARDFDRSMRMGDLYEFAGAIHIKMYGNCREKKLVL